MSDELLDLDYKPHMPPKTDYGIGIVGCGGIVQYAVLPTYKKHGLNVLASHDINHATAESVAAEFDIPNVYENLEELLANPAIEIVEISVPAVS